MANYRRNFVPGGTYFFTVVTHRRRNIFQHDLARKLLGKAFREINERRPFRVEAIVLLPDHLHTVWTLREKDSDYPTRWRLIKQNFTRSYLAAGFSEAKVSQGRKQKGDRGVWQRRYYEHTVRDEDDLKRCIDYVHINPLKHKLVARVRDWQWSTFHRYVRKGEYSIDWGSARDFYGDEWLQYE